MTTHMTIRATTFLLFAFAATMSAACEKAPPTPTSTTAATQTPSAGTAAPVATNGAATAVPAASHMMPNGMPMPDHSAQPMGGGPMNGAPHEMGMQMDGGNHK